MAVKLGVLIIHGIGTQKSDFADGMINNLVEQLGELGFDRSDVAWQPVHWTPVLEPKQKELWRKLSHNSDMSFVTLRQFVINVLGDAIAYQRVPGQGRENVYDSTHRVIHQSVKTLRQQIGGDKPLVILAHSLGCYMISNYIWDRQKGLGEAAYAASAFERMETIAGMVTFGCGIPLFMLAYTRIEPITFPSSTLARYFPDGTPPEELRRAAHWLNFYSRNDILGYPLRPLSPEYAETVNEDIAINVGGLLTSWNPASHTQYWTDSNLIRPAAELIGGLLKLL